jgi:hypothetical protein
MNRRVWQSLLLLAGLYGLPAAARAQADVAGGELPPPGFGSLRQDNVSLRITLNDIDVRFLPLDERLLRLLAPDAYESLHGLVESRRTAIDSAAQEAGIGKPGLALVSFFALRKDARFDPQNISLSYHNQLERPAAIVPTSGNFSGRQLEVRRSASAIYLFDTPIPVYEQFDLRYGTSQGTWSSDIGRRIEIERARVQSKWQAARADSAAGQQE